MSRTAFRWPWLPLPLLHDPERGVGQEDDFDDAVEDGMLAMVEDPAFAAAIADGVVSAMRAYLAGRAEERGRGEGEPE